MKTKFLGHCQACGRKHKVPNGIAKHGYKVSEWGFAGTCVGSGHAPYEVSCDLIKDIINVQDQLVGKIALQIQEVKDLEGNFAYVNYPLEKTPWSKTFPKLVEIKEVLNAWNRPEYLYFHEEFKVDRQCFRHCLYPTSMQEAKTRLNDEHIKRLNAEIARTLHYIAWQTKRVLNWKEEKLIEVIY